MEIANIVLEYLKVLLNWPLLIFALALVFKEPISEFLKKIRKIGFPGGQLDAAADEASSEVDEVSISIATNAVIQGRPDEAVEQPQQTSEPSSESPDTEPAQRPYRQSLPASKDSEAEGGPTRAAQSDEIDWLVSRGLKEVDVSASMSKSQNYENLRKMGLITPQIAVQEAYQRVRLNARRILEGFHPTEHARGTIPLGEIFERLADYGLIGRSTVNPARSLDRIYATNREKGELSPSGALSFIDAAQKLEMLLIGIEPPSTRLSEQLWRAERVASDLTEKWKLDGKAKIWRTEAFLHISLEATNEEIESEPRLSGFISDVQAMQKRIGVKVRMHFKKI